MSIDRAAAAAACLLGCLLAAAPALRPVQAAGADDPRAARAIELYDAGRYAEARAALEEIDGRGEADGKMLYRLFYCQRQAGDDRATETLRRSVELLEREPAAQRDLEAGFYLANGLSSLGRAADATRAAAAVTGAFEAGAAAGPEAGIDRFRLGKLYADQNKPAEAERWYAAALESFEREQARAHDAYEAWAARYLADATFARDEFADAERHLSTLVRLEKPTTRDLDRLAVCRARLGSYAAAAKAWREAELLDPANADRARYCYRLAEAAARLDGLSAATPEGRLWTELTREELESALRDRAAEVRAVAEEARAAGRLDGPARAALQARLDAARPVFVAAGLEYALRGHSIREAAFFGGYAPLIFKDGDWKVPRQQPGAAPPAKAP